MIWDWIYLIRKWNNLPISGVLFDFVTQQLIASHDFILLFFFLYERRGDQIQSEAFEFMTWKPWTLSQPLSSECYYSPSWNVALQHSYIFTSDPTEAHQLICHHNKICHCNNHLFHSSNMLVKCLPQAKAVDNAWQARQLLNRTVSAEWLSSYCHTSLI